MNKTVLEEISNIGIVPVVTIHEMEDAIPLADALYHGGIACAEVTFRSKFAAEAIRDICKHNPSMLIGAGTVTTVEQAKRSIENGAKFIVTPGFHEDVVKWCVDNNVTIIPGISSASEIALALSYNLTYLKFFPAESSGGVRKIKDLSGPYNNITFLPTGGINQANMHEYLSQPNIEAIGGSFMLPNDIVLKKDWDEITRLSKEAIASLLNYQLIHLGIDNDSKEEADKFASLLCNLFNFKKHDKPKSCFAGKGFELLFQKGPGTKGHIGIYTPYPSKALYQLKKQGISSLENTVTRNKKTGRINFVYLDLDINGFAVHLINPDIKM